MLCGRVRELLAAYVDGEVTAAAAQQLEQHAERCAACKAALRKERQTRVLLQLSDTTSRPMPDMRLRLAHALAGEGRRRRRRSYLWSGTAVALIACMLAALSLHAVSSATPGTATRVVPVQRAVHRDSPICWSCVSIVTRARRHRLPVQGLALLAEALDAARQHVARSDGASWRNAAVWTLPARSSLKGGELSRTKQPPQHGLPVS